MTPYLEIGGDYREVLPGVHVLELPLPFSLGLINVYLVRLPEGWLLVDCGMDTEACQHAITRELEGLNVGWSDIRLILLTHIHPDHMGLARKLLDLTGARLLLHRADRDLLAEIAQTEKSRAWQRDVMTAAGVPPDMVALIGSSLFDIQKNFQALDPQVVLSGGETIAAAPGELQVIWTPGHSPGHVCLYLPARRVLFSGDHMLEHISPNIGWQPGRDALGEFLASLDRIAELEVDLILPSHGAPFTGHREWVRKTHEHHAERCARILSAVNGGAKTANDLVPLVWDRALSPFHYRFALFEVLAHLEYLARRGRVRARKQGEITEYAAA